MKVLIGCEESQVVCQAFRRAGHEAYSCDILPTRGNPDWHYQHDIMFEINRHSRGYYDLIILHPDCTAMAVSGNRWYGKDMPMHDKRIQAIEWTLELWRLAISRCNHVALENPASVIFPALRKEYYVPRNIQYIQPWQFGHTETKKTGLALYNLPDLVETDNVYEEMMKLELKDRHKVWYASPGENRKRDRSETYRGIADAMAEQWGAL